MTTYLQKILILALLFLTASLAVNSSIHLAPRLNLAANDITYEFGATGNVLVWQFEAHESNDNPTSYTVKIDGVDLTGHIEASWEDNVDILVNVDGLNVGDHTVLIIVNDDGTDASLAPAATDTAIVTVTGGTSTTTTATSTTITSTTTTTTSTSVTSSQTSTLTPATSSFSTVTTTTESQTAANTATSTISTSETIIGDNKPKISSETDKTLNEGATGFSLSWTASDDNPDEYVIKVNKVSVQTNSWQSGVVIEYSLDGLSIGVYSILIEVFDLDGNSALDEVSVEVVSDIGATSEDPPSLPLSFSGIFLALLFTLVIVRSNHRNKYDQR